MHFFRDFFYKIRNIVFVMPTQNWIRAALKEKGFKLKDAAEALGVPAPRVTDILKGARGVQSSEIIPLARLLGMNTPSLLKSLEMGELIHVPGDEADRLPLLGCLTGDGTVAALPDLGFASVAPPPDAKRLDGLYCYMMGDGSMAHEVPAGSLVIAADPKLHFAPIVPGTLLLIRRGGDRLVLRQYVKSENGEDWLMPMPDQPDPTLERWRFSLLSALMPSPGGVGGEPEIKIDDVMAVVLWVHVNRAPQAMH